MKIRCVYRLDSMGEIILGYFDDEKGCICEHPEIMQLDLQRLYNMRETCPTAQGITDDDLIGELLNYECRCIVINYIGIGTIAITDKDTQLVLKEAGDVFKAWELNYSPFKVKAGRIVGHMCVKLKTMRWLQLYPVVNTVYLPNGEEVFYTQSGRYYVSSDLEEFNELTGPYYKDIYLNREFGYGKSAGRRVYLALENNRLIPKGVSADV